MEIDRTLRHDAKNFLNAIRLNLDALELVDSTQDKVECLEAIESAADSALEWVDRFEQWPGFTGNGTSAG